MPAIIRKRALQTETKATMKIKPATMMLAMFLAHLPLSADAFAFSTGSASPSAAAAATYDIQTTSLNFRNGDEEDLKYKKGHRLSKSNENEQDTTSMNRWFKPATPKSEQEEASERVDEYLKFLDKRYHQIHDMDIVPSEAPADKKNAFPVLRWLHKEEGFEYNKDNAFYALNSAAEQVESLNQQQIAEEKETVDVVPVVDQSKLRSAILSMKQSRIYQKIAHSRAALIRYEASKAQQIALAALRAVKRIPEVPAMILKAGGGRMPLTLASGVLSVVLFHVLLPAVGSFVKESIATQA